jgi:hypothetical protein
MKKRLTYISPLQLGIVLGILYGIVSIVFLIPCFLIMSLVGAASARTGAQAIPVIFTGVFMIFLPVIYAVLGFIGGVITAFIYNLVAKWTGGVEFTTQDVQ